MPVNEKEIIKQYGEGVLIPASLILEDDIKIVSVSPAIDVGLHGGVPEGSWLNVSGKAKCGKSSTILQFIKNAQDMGKKAFYLSIEGRLKKMNLEGITGLNTDNLTVIKSTKDKFLTAEDYLQIAENIIKSEPGCVLVFDSLSALCGASEMTADITGQFRSTAPRTLSLFCKRMGQVIPVMKSVVVNVQHLIANTSGYGAAFMEDGGNKIQYQSDIKIRCKSSSAWMSGESQIGQVVTWDVVWSALGPPGMKVDSYLRYGYGLDKTTELINLGLDFGIVEKAGSWLTFQGKKVQGQENLYNVLCENSEMLESLEKAVKELC